MTLTTTELERTAAMPMAAPTGVVAGACVCSRPVHASGPVAFRSMSGLIAAYRPMNAGKPWTMGGDRQGNEATTRPARLLGRLST